jgi:hypothetical protein
VVAFLLLLVISFIIGSLGKNRKLGFWGYFFCSLALTPIIGFIMLLASGPNQEQA